VQGEVPIYGIYSWQWPESGSAVLFPVMLDNLIPADHYVPRYLRTFPSVDALGRCPGRNRPREAGIQPQSDHKRARSNQVDRRTSSRLIQHSGGNTIANSENISEGTCVLPPSHGLSFVTHLYPLRIPVDLR